MTLTLSLDDVKAQGGEKYVFIHPQNKSLLVKVLNKSFIDHMNKNWPITTSLRRHKYYWSYINEIVEYLFMHQEHMEQQKFLQTFIGVTPTSLGLGLVYKAIKTADGELAPTLRTLIRTGRFQDRHQKAFDEFVAWLNEQYLIVRDLALQNLVWDESEQCFVLIDGIGARRLPSLRCYICWYNRHGNRKRTRKLTTRLHNELQKFSNNR